MPEPVQNRRTEALQACDFKEISAPRSAETLAAGALLRGDQALIDRVRNRAPDAFEALRHVTEELAPQAEKLVALASETESRRNMANPDSDQFESAAELAQEKSPLLRALHAVSELFRNTAG